MNVNATIVCVRIGSLQAAQPNDARDDGIATGRIRDKNFSGPTAIMKDGAGRGMIADFLRDLQEPKWCSQSPQVIAQAKSRSRNRINSDFSSVL